MATVARSEAHLSVAYDGDPQFAPIEGASAPMKYALNSGTPVIQTADGMYYAVEDGVWFVSASSDGPWTAATSVPNEIYSIPVSSPVHYVTYVHVYDSTPDYVFAGYTPGYFGAIYTDGVVVYGTGYAYPPWIGSVWIGSPWTWGFGIGAGIAFGVGFGLGFAHAHHHAFVHPWWGPGRHGPVPAYGSAYRHWQPAAVYAPPARAVAPRAAPPVGPQRQIASPRVGPPASPVGPRMTAPPASRAMPSSPRAAPPVMAPRVAAPPAFNPPPHVAPPTVAPQITAPHVTVPHMSAPRGGGGGRHR
jgi:hypothetical protein